MQIDRQYKIKDGLINTYALEFFAAKHCNLKCLGCAQSSPYLNKKFANVDLFEETLNVINKYIKPEKFKILGGEPLLHPNINNILQISQNSKIFKSVYIVTNGLKLLEMDSEFWRNVDVIRISLYQANKKFFEKTFLIDHNFLLVIEKRKAEPKNFRFRFLILKTLFQEKLFFLCQ